MRPSPMTSTSDAVGGKEPAPDGLHEEQSPAAGLLRHACRLPGVECERLLAQDVLPGLQEGRWCRPRDASAGWPRRRRRRRGRRRARRSRRTGSGCRTGRRTPSARSAEREATAVMVPPSAHCIASAKPAGDDARPDHAPADHRGTPPPTGHRRPRSASMVPFPRQETSRSDNAIIGHCLGQRGGDGGGSTGCRVEATTGGP